MKRLSHAPALLFLWTYARKHLALLLVLLLMLIVSTALMLVAPFFYKAAVDAVSSAQAGDAAALRFAITQILYGLGASGIAMTLEQVSAMLLGVVELRVMRQANLDVFAKIQRHATEFHVNTFAGATARKMGRGIESLENIMDRIWFNLLPTVAFVIGFLIVLGFYAPMIGIVMLVGTVAVVVIAYFLNSYLGQLYAWADEQDTRMVANVVDVITANPLVKSFAGETREDARHDSLLAEWQRRILRAWWAKTGVQLSQFYLLIIIEGCVLSLAIYLWYQGLFTVGGFIVVMLYVVQLWGRLWDFGRNVQEYMKSVAHTQEMLAIIEKPLQIADKTDAKVLKVNDGAIVFDRVHFRYDRQDKAVFGDFSVSIKPGERIALVGHSGGGKSTFVKVLLRLYDIQDGVITVDDQDIAQVTQESLRQSIALVPQDPILFHRSLAENIAYGKPDATMQDIERAAKLAHAHEFIDVLPHRYETLVGERGVKLSGGERQRVAIARAILADRPILILDEATSSLDSLSEHYIQDALTHLMQGRTSIVIAHRLSTIKQADRILVIEDGHIVEEGSHASLLKKEGGIYQKLYEMQAGGFIGE